MKKILLSAVAVMALGYAAQAQSEDMKFGVKAGLNISNLGGDMETDGSRTGLHIGGVAEFKISETFSVQPEILYSMMGAKVKEADFESLDVVEYDINLDYLSIPIMAKYYVAEGFSVEAGPYVSFLMSAKEDGNDAKDYYKGVDFGLGGGVAYDLPMGVFFQIRYSAGLSDINDFEVEGLESAKITNNALQVSVGYKF